MEKEVTIRCRKADQGVIEGILPECTKEYIELIKREVPKFRDQKITLKLSVDKTYLPEFNAKATALPSWYSSPNPAAEA